MGYCKHRRSELKERGFKEVEGAVCAAHLVDEALAERLDDCVSERTCLACGRQDDLDADPPFAVPLENLTSVLVETIKHFYANADDVLLWDSEERTLFGPQMDVWEVVGNISDGAFDSETNDMIVEKVIEVIGCDISWTPWSADAETDDLDYAWSQFSQVAKYQCRLVVGMGSPSDPPGRLAEFLEKFAAYASDELELIRTLPAGASFYRGRLCEQTSSIDASAGGLGPAPEGKAAANRLSPAGVSLFYGSADPQTAIAEIAGHGADPYAVIGRFTNTRTLRILDFTQKSPRPSPFNLTKREQARMARFLDSFVRYVTAPVIPDDRQHVDYAPTQMLTEYLRWVPQPKLDGIALPSAQDGLPTYVLFFGRSNCGATSDLEDEAQGEQDFDDSQRICSCSILAMSPIIS